MISDRALASMRATLAQTRTDTAIISRPIATRDAAGGVGVEHVAIDTDVPCRLAGQGMQPWEKLDPAEGKVVATSVWNIALPPGQDVQPQDRITIGGITYSVIASKAPRTIELERSVQAVLVQ